MSTDEHLSSPAGLLAYLTTTAPAKFRPKDSSIDSIALLEGGNANFVYRIDLEVPFEDIESDGSSVTVEKVVVKHAEDYLKNSKFFALEARRMDMEYASLAAMQTPALQAVFLNNQSSGGRGSADNTDKRATALTPKVFHYDSSSHTMFMQDLGDGSLNLKAFVKSLDRHAADGLSQNTAASFGRALGLYLANLHSIPLEKVLAASQTTVNSYTIARDITCLAYYQHVRSSVAKVLTDLDTETLDELERISKTKEEELRLGKEVFTHGDFWTGNVLLNPKALQDGSTANTRLFVLDWELSKPGTRWYDVGAFLAELYLLYIFSENDEQQQFSKSLIDNFLLEYRQVFVSEHTGEEMNIDEIAIRAGCHLAVMFPHTGWTTDEKRIERIVEDGVHLMLSGGRKVAQVALRDSVIFSSLH